MRPLTGESIRNPLGHTLCKTEIERLSTNLQNTLKIIRQSNFCIFDEVKIITYYN